MSLKTKLLGVITIPVLGLIVTLVIAYDTSRYSSRMVEEGLTQVLLPLITEDIPQLTEYHQSLQYLLEADSALHRAFLSEKVALAAVDDEEMRRAETLNAEMVQTVRDRAAKASQALPASAGPVYAEFQQILARWETATQNVIKLAKEPDNFYFARKSSTEGSASKAYLAVNESMGKLGGILQKAVKDFMTGLEVKKGDVATRSALMVDTQKRWVTLFLTVGPVVVVVVFAVGFVFARKLTSSIQRTIMSLTQSAQQVASAAQQINTGSRVIARGTTEQASSLDQISANLQSMAAMTHQNAKNAVDSRQLAEEARATAQNGNDAMNRMSETIGRIRTSANDTAHILKTIDDIAFQTNLLALNAAVEAAHAGDAGRGFAVVAEEVRSLARRSSEAAQSTAEIIAQSQKNAESGVTVSAEVEGVLKRVADGIQKVVHLVAEVSAASREQAQGIEQISDAASQMNQVTQSNAANAQQSSSGSEELSAQAQELQAMVNVLGGIIGISGSTGQHRWVRKVAGGTSPATTSTS